MSQNYLKNSLSSKIFLDLHYYLQTSNNIEFKIPFFGKKDFQNSGKNLKQHFFIFCRNLKIFELAVGKLR